MQNKNIIRPLLITLLILAVPFLAGLFTDQVAWDLGDFVVAGLLLFGAGLAIEITASRGGAIAYRAAIMMAIATTLLLVWMNLAVGIIGNENQPINLLYFGLVAIGLVSAFLVWFRPQKMSYIMFILAVGQMLVPLIALIFLPQVSWGEAGVVRIFVLNAFFATSFALSGFLFRQTRKPLN